MIRVHAFSCVLALALASLLHRRVHASGLDMRPGQLLSHLKGIKDMTAFYPAANGAGKHLGGRPRAALPLTRLDAQQKKLVATLD